MKPLPLLWIALLGLVLAGPASRLFAGPAWSWGTTLDTIVAIGDTRYLMERTGYTYSSELVFPLDTLLAGVTFRGERDGGLRDGRRAWGFEASLAVNLLAPFTRMTDSDWLMSPVYPKAAFSYTESDVTMICLLAAASWRRVLRDGDWGELEVNLGFRLQYLSQEANGYNGWYYDDLDDNGQYELYGQSSSGLALSYWVLWNVPTVGMSVTLSPAPGVSVRAEAGAAAPIVADEDDHVLRNFLATAVGVGFGGYAQLSLDYSWGMLAARARPFVRLSLDFMALKAQTSQTVTYYGDDPASEGYVEQPGETRSGIDHQLSTRQLRVVLACGASY